MACMRITGASQAEIHLKFMVTYKPNSGSLFASTGATRVKFSVALRPEYLDPLDAIQSADQVTAFFDSSDPGDPATSPTSSRVNIQVLTWTYNGVLSSSCNDSLIDPPPPPPLPPWPTLPPGPQTPPLPPPCPVFHHSSDGWIGAVYSPGNCNCANSTCC